MGRAATTDDMSTTDGLSTNDLSGTTADDLATTDTATSTTNGLRSVFIDSTWGGSESVDVSTMANNLMNDK